MLLTVFAESDPKNMSCFEIKNRQFFNNPQIKMDQVRLGGNSGYNNRLLNLLNSLLIIAGNLFLAQAYSLSR